MAPDRSAFLVAAAAYNVSWGLAAIAAPQRLARTLGFIDSGDGMGWRAAGVVVLAYAPAYLWASNYPNEARPILATALLGKVIGVAGWVVGVVTRRFGWRTGLLPVMNDAIWLPGLINVMRARQPAGGHA